MGKKNKNTQPPAGPRALAISLQINMITLPSTLCYFYIYYSSREANEHVNHQKEQWQPPSMDTMTRQFVAGLLGGNRISDGRRVTDGGGRMMKVIGKWNDGGESGPRNSQSLDPMDSGNWYFTSAFYETMLFHQPCRPVFVM
ncbi:hypothetical protein EVAR_96160_1 [Eumeta japonica]|uniref:Uncharacterized protein n=1 Tax=Eumeta variegata TaxID=151549 RepID=A0A4C1VHG7_EUMVA|nr:hypothetical protein EVAR_96160_1 [Eumeta japonica]